MGTVRYKMCTQNMTQTKMRCGHKIESEGIKIACPQRCGNYKVNWSFGSTTKREPCGDCQANGKWKKENGKWKRS